jgi:hypothetical protein
MVDAEAAVEVPDRVRQLGAGVAARWTMPRCERIASPNSSCAASVSQAVMNSGGRPIGWAW